MTRLYLYSLYERLWHWLQALLISMLIVTGLEIHYPALHLFGTFTTLINAHTAMGLVLTANAFLALFYYLSTGQIRQFIPKPREFMTEGLKLAAYYARGILRGDSYPFERDSEHKLNPIQKATYFVILNFLLPLQVLTGMLMWASQRWPAAIDSLAPLAFLARAHTLVAWLFIPFLIVHLYMITTGPTVLAHLRTMLTGWEAVGAEEKTVATREEK